MAGAHEDLGFQPEAELDDLGFQPEGPHISQGRAGVLGVAQGGTLGFADELGGLIGKLVLPKSNVRLGKGALPSEEDSPELRSQKVEALVQEKLAHQKTDYERVRDSMRDELSQARAEHPKTVLAGEVLGSLAVPVPGGAAAKGASFGARALRATLQGAGMGATYGLGASDADIANGDVKGALKDTAMGAALGGAGGAVGETLATGGKALVNAVRQRAARGVKEAVEAETAKQLALAEKSIRGKQGEYRSAVQSASRDLEVLEREASQLPPGQLRDKVQQYLSSPEGMAVREQVAGNKLSTAPERISEMQTHLEQLKQLAANKEANVETQTAAALDTPWTRHMKPRLATLGHRVLPPALAAVGGYVGGPEGAVVGGLLGGGMALIQGRSGIVLRNMLREPAVRKAAWETVQKATELGPAAGTKAEALVNALRGVDEKAGLSRLHPNTVSRQEARALIEALRNRASISPGSLASEETQ